MDKTIDILEKELRILAHRLFETEMKSSQWSEDEVQNIQIVVRDFILQNATAIEQAATMFSKLSQTDRKELAEHHNLTLSLVPDTHAESFVYSALKKARSKGWDLKILRFSSSQIEMLPRVLSYAKFIVDTDLMKPKMTPVKKFLPRHLTKLAEVKRRNGDVIITITVYGSLASENKDAFESIEFAKSLQLQREAEASASRSNHLPDMFETFRTILLCPQSSLNKILNILESRGFTIQNV